MSEDVEFISSEFDIFVKNPIQSAILDNHVVRHKPIAMVDQNDLEFLVPGDNETYIDINFKLFVKGRLLGSSNGPGLGSFGVGVAVEVLKRCRGDVGG